MSLPIAQGARVLPILRQRPPQENIPQERAEREAVLKAVQDYVAEAAPTPPVPLEELRVHAGTVAKRLGLDEKFHNYIAVILNNEMWRDALAAIPYERRLLLLPKCLRDESRCPAPFDEFGLLCKQCGLCSIEDLEQEAERLGYAVLVAEGSTIVMNIIETGKIEAIVGVSCLNVLEKAFPYMEAAAIPGVSIPLLQDDCANCTVDLEWVWEVIHLTSDDKTRRLDLNGLRETVSEWFDEDELNAVMGEPQGETETIARQWLMKHGKRWRPYLAVCAHQSLQETPLNEFPIGLKKLAIAVECFHKASLIHDDIEDDDRERYNELTLHEEYGIPAALNAGDLLLGEGYRLIGECGVAPDRIVKMLQIASEGQRKLCQGQGAELAWTNTPAPMKSDEVINIFRLKTAPAFEVALRLGLLYADAPEDIDETISKYSEALGVAYQIHDDLQDWAETRAQTERLRPHIILANAYERSRGELKDAVAAIWRCEQSFNDRSEAHKNELVFTKKVEDRSLQLLEFYKFEAISALKPLTNPSLKGLLRRVIGKIFNDIEIKGWCSEFEARNAPDRQAVVSNAG
ncbi:DUF116 domain-containing protein [bacterium]|nr:DUF116 domain-containing protein [bacterium]